MRRQSRPGSVRHWKLNCSGFLEPDSLGRIPWAGFDDGCQLEAIPIVFQSVALRSPAATRNPWNNIGRCIDTAATAATADATAAADAAAPWWPPFSPLPPIPSSRKEAETTQQIYKKEIKKERKEGRKKERKKNKENLAVTSFMLISRALVPAGRNPSAVKTE